MQHRGIADGRRTSREPYAAELSGAKATRTSTPTILSVQSHVAYGHVGNAAAVFPLQRLGCEVWPVHTVLFSNHPGHGAFRGEILAAELVRDCLEGIAERGVLDRCDAVLSGYLGSRDTAQAVLDIVGRIKRANPEAIFCCDPVIGDVGKGVYVRPDLAAFVRDHGVPQADILAPNLFELQFLVGAELAGIADVAAACRSLHARGPGIVVVTSVVLAQTPRDSIDTIVSAGTGVWRVRTPRLPIDTNGAGDAFAAIFLAQWLRSRDAERALRAAASSLFGILARTHAAGSRELMLVEAQDELVAPTQVFPVEQLQLERLVD